MTDAPVGPEFNAERGRHKTLAALGLVCKTLQLNEALCIKVAVEELSAPNEHSAKALLALCLSLLSHVAHHVETNPVSDARLKVAPGETPH